MPAAKAKSAPVAEEIDLAIEVFARGFAITRSFTHPYHAERVGPLWVMRDGPRKRPGDYRREEWISRGIEPAKVDALARKQTRGRFSICDIRSIHEPDAPIREAYRALGYRLHAAEVLMVHRLTRIPRLPEPFPIAQVKDQQLADRLAKAVGRRQSLPEHLAADSPLRSYVALDGGQPIGWLRSIVVGDSTWVSNVFVQPKYRRRGIAQSMLARMLRDDRAHVAKRSILLASHAGAQLYPTVGYELIGELLLYTPREGVTPEPMDTTTLLLALLFGTAGFAYFVYGKKTAQFIPLGAGIGLMVIPYFISNNWLLVAVCLAMMAVPFVWRDG